MKVSKYVNPGKRTCVVVISDCEYDVIRRVRKMFRSNNIDSTIPFRGENSFLNGPFKGKARCAPEDEFDSEIGLEIARERAYAKYARAYNRELDYIYDKLTTAADALDSFYRDDDFDDEE